MPPLDNSAEYDNPIPKAIRRQSAQADVIAREAGVVNVPDEPIVEEPALQMEPAPEPVVAAEPAPAPAPAEEDFRHQYQTLRGKYDSELPALRNQVSQLERLIASMQTVPPPAAPEPRVTTTVPVEIPAADVETYGQDLIDAVVRWVTPQIEARVGARFGEVETKLGQVQTGQQRFQQQSTQDRVLQALDADAELGTHWRALDVNPDFLAWCDQADPFAGRKRLDLLREAFGQGDVVRVGRFYKTYIAEHTATQTPATTPAQTAPAEQADRPTLESLAEPGRPTGSGPNNSGAPEKRIWTTRDITAFYRDVQKDRFKNNEAERLRLEMDIFAAPLEGRLRQ
jgi:hypothetical protein